MEDIVACCFLIIPYDRTKPPPLRKWEPPRPPSPPPSPPDLPKSPSKYKLREKKKKKEFKSRYPDDDGVEDEEDGDDIVYIDDSSKGGVLSRWFPCFTGPVASSSVRHKKREIVPIIDEPRRRTSIYDRKGIVYRNET